MDHCWLSELHVPLSSAQHTVEPIGTGWKLYDKASYMPSWVDNEKRAECSAMVSIINMIYHLHHVDTGDSSLLKADK